MKCFYIEQRLVPQGRETFIRAHPCAGEAQSNGWCDVHQHGHEVMQIGQSRGYPRIQVNEYLTIGAGYTLWLAYAEVASAHRVLQVKRALKRYAGEKVTSDE